MIKIRMLKDVFGFEKGFTYNATPKDDGYIVINGVYKGFVFNEDVEVTCPA